MKVMSTDDEEQPGDVQAPSRHGWNREMASHHPRPTETMLVFDSMRIRTKLAVALIIPLVALLGLATVAISASNQKADDAAARAAKINDQVDLATASLGPSGVIAAIQNERNGEAVDLIGVADIALQPGQTPENLRAADDAAIASFKSAIAARSAAVQEAYQPAIDAMNTIPSLRAASDAYSGPRTLDGASTVSNETFNQYTDIANAVFDGNSKVALSIDDADLRAGATYIDQFSRYQEANTLLLAKIANAATKPGGLTGDLDAYGLASEYNGEALSLKGDMAGSTVPFYVELTDTTFANPDLDASDAVVEKGLAARRSMPRPLIGGELNQGAHVYNEAVVAAAADHLQADADALTAQAEKEQSDAESQAQLVLIATGAVLLLAVGVTLLASRSITRPSPAWSATPRTWPAPACPTRCRTSSTPRSVRTSSCPSSPRSTARRLRDRRGRRRPSTRCRPAPSTSPSSRPCSAATSPTRSSTSAVATRTSSAASSTSSPRWSATRPTPTSSRSSSRLDHLATRMRRNAESLLVLAGLEPHRQWSRPVPSSTSCAPPSARSRTTSGSSSDDLDAADRQRHRRRRPHPPARRAPRERASTSRRPGVGRDHGPGLTPTATRSPSSTTASA